VKDKSVYSNATILQVVAQLYGVDHASLPGNVAKEAHEFLLQFQMSPESWGVLPLLFKSPVSTTSYLEYSPLNFHQQIFHVQFFAAHTMYTKIGLEW